MRLKEDSVIQFSVPKYERRKIHVIVIKNYT